MTQQANSATLRVDDSPPSERATIAAESGSLVLCDRYADSTLAYQGYGHGVDLAQLRHLLKFATGNLWPDLTILLDIPPQFGLERKRSAGEWNRLDAYTLDFHDRVRAGYQEMARQEPQRWVTIDANQPMDVVQNKIRAVVIERLARRIVTKAI